MHLKHLFRIGHLPFISVRDWGIVGAVAVLSLFGLSALVSVSAATEEGRPWRHFAGILMGCVLMFLLGRLRSHHLRMTAHFIYGACLLLLVAVLVVGTDIRGTKGWILIGSLSVQPVEYMKIGLVLMLASYFERARLRTPIGALLAKSSLFAAPPVALTLMQPDVGSALVLVVIWWFFVFLQMSWRSRLILLSGTLLVGLMGWFLFFQEHQRERLRVLVDSSRDPFGAGYNIRQSIIAVGSGKLIGRGLGEGSQSQLQFLPEAATDFAFALIAEELGFAGALFLLFAFAVLIGRMLIHFARAPDDFSAYVLVGIGGWWFFQTSVYVGMNLGIAPVVGVPLPFVSYGGSSLLASFLAAGCVLAVCGESTVARDA